MPLSRILLTCTDCRQRIDVRDLATCQREHKRENAEVTNLLLCTLQGGVVPEKKRICVATFTDGITLESIPLSLVSYPLFVFVSALETDRLLVTSDDFPQHPG